MRPVFLSSLVFFLLLFSDGRVPGSFHAAAEACLSLRSYKARPLSVINFFILDLIFIHRAKAKGPTGESGGFTTRRPPAAAATAATSKPSTTSATWSPKRPSRVGPQAACSLLYSLVVLHSAVCCSRSTARTGDDSRSSQEKSCSCCYTRLSNYLKCKPHLEIWPPPFPPFPPPFIQVATLHANRRRGRLVSLSFV